MKFPIFQKLWTLFNILSLDVVSGALAGMYFFQQVLDVVVPIQIYWLLAIAVWSIYTTDHLLDASRKTSSAFSARHAFHRKFKLPIIIGLCFAVGLGLGIVFLNSALHFILPYGFGLSALIGIWYLLLFKFKKEIVYFKELITALFYTSGIGLAPMVLADIRLEWMQLLLMVLYALVAFINLLMLSYMDRAYDQAHEFGSIGDRLTKVQHKNLCFGFLYLVLGLLVIAILSALSFYKVYFGILLLIAGVHFRELRLIDHNLKSRQIMEISFSFPWLLVLF